jgi:hypothetical protein
LAMLPSVVPKVSFSAGRPSTCTFRIHHNYKFDTARFEEGKRPSYRRDCDRTKLSRDAWTQRALADQDDKKFSNGRKKLTTAKPSGLVRPHGGSVKAKARSHRLEQDSMISRGH